MQMSVIEKAQAGGNIFLTGVAGTGKSAVTERIVSDARAAGKQVAVAAPTGVAALNIGGCTLHSVAKLKPPTRAAHFGAMYTTAKDDWKKMDVLVLDEVGMIKADFIEFMDVEARGIRHCLDKPFGGIQLVLVGDFAQLGPVNKGPSLQQPCHSPTDAGADIVMDLVELCGLAFQTAMWREADFHCYQLETIHRQNGDEDFIRALIDVRKGRITPAVEQLRTYCARPLESKKGTDGLAIEPTVLYCTNANVDLENIDKLNELPGEMRMYRSLDAVQVHPDVARTTSCSV